MSVPFNPLYSLSKNRQQCGRFENKEEVLAHLNEELAKFRELNDLDKKLIDSKRLLPKEETMRLLQYSLWHGGCMPDESPHGFYIES